MATIDEFSRSCSPKHRHTARGRPTPPPPPLAPTRATDTTGRGRQRQVARAIGILAVTPPHPHQRVTGPRALRRRQGRQQPPASLRRKTACRRKLRFPFHFEYPFGSELKKFQSRVLPSARARSPATSMAEEQMKEVSTAAAATSFQLQFDKQIPFQWQVDELEKAISVAARNPEHYGLSEAEIRKRRSWTSTARNQSNYMAIKESYLVSNKIIFMEGCVAAPEL